MVQRRRNSEGGGVDLDFFSGCFDMEFPFIKKETLAQVFSCEFSKISKSTFSYRTPQVAASTVKQKN